MIHPENHRCLQDDFDGREDCPQCTTEDRLLGTLTIPSDPNSDDARPRDS